MNRTLIITADGSHSVHVPEGDLTYHSRYGAIQESMQVFIESGLKPALEKFTEPLHIFEMGLGTGLNALLTLANRQQRAVYYQTCEPFPLEAPAWQGLNYCSRLERPDLAAPFRLLHDGPWEIPMDLGLEPEFRVFKTCRSLEQFETATPVHLVYFDAFAPAAQPHLWTTEIFSRIHGFTRPGGMLLTYCSKVSVQRALKEAGFRVEKLPGPWGKREMLRAIKPG